MTELRAAETITDQGDATKTALTLLDQLLSWKNEKWEAPLDMWRALIPGMAHKVGEVTETFLGLVSKRQLSNLCVREGHLEVEREIRPHHILGQELGDGTLAVMAVRIAEYGKDLYVEWDNYAFSIQVLSTTERWGKGCLGALLIYPGIALFFLPAILGWVWLNEALKGRRVDKGQQALKGYQQQDAWAFKEAIHASLKEALDLVGISAEMIREMPKEKRVI